MVETKESVNTISAVEKLKMSGGMKAEPNTKVLRLGSKVPNFQAMTTQGKIDFHEWKQDSWAILFSHPEDFTPVCTTELGAIARLGSEWKTRGCKVIGLSCNTLESHEKWIHDINETQNCTLEFPIIADKDRTVATLYDMLDYQDPTNIDKNGMPLTVRSVFFIDAKNTLRASLTYPASTGRNAVELLRVLDSLMLNDAHKVCTPVNWVVGDDVIVPPSISTPDATEKFGQLNIIKPYLRTVKMSQLHQQLQ